MRKNKFLKSVCNKKALYIDNDGSFSVESSWSASIEDMKSALTLGNHPRRESGNVRKRFELFSSLAVKVLLDLVSKMADHVG